MENHVFIITELIEKITYINILFLLEKCAVYINIFNDISEGKFPFEVVNITARQVMI
jgi:hypothetical protein